VQAQTRTAEDLDRRRGWARFAAVVACLAGTLVFGLSCAGLVLLGFVAVARFWSFWGDTDFADVPLWSLAPGGAAVFGLLVVALSLLAVFFYFWRGAGRQVLAEVAARPADPQRHRNFLNIAEELSIGIGRTPPTVYVSDDEVPNSLSVRTSNARALVLTTGCLQLPRHEIEALCAHEIGHLWADDAHWVTAGMVVLARARRFARVIMAAGAFVATIVGAFAYYSDFEVVLWSTFLLGVAMAALGWMSHIPLRKLELSVRRQADRIADDVAVKLAKNPESLGAVCLRLGANPGRVGHSGWRSELMWFEAVHDLDHVSSSAHLFAKPDELAAQARPIAESMAADELRCRAREAYRTAGAHLPAALA
jgi:Zn-dependent protease with chaperone function